ncbi:MAG TPA: hypothetical protein VEK08_15130 [Planctomycetota bacterium]|nr:hypothetical protein [Planctomycetota bacterium]
MTIEKRGDSFIQVARARQTRGSVLLFVIIMLAMLAMLGTTFLLFVRQSRRVSQNVINTSEADLAAQAGLIHAQKALRAMVRDHVICSRDGVFDPATPGYKFSNMRFWTTPNQPPMDNPYWHFEIDPVSVPGVESAVLSSPESGILKFSAVPLRCGGTGVLSAASLIEEHAQLVELQGSTNDFYKQPALPTDPVRQLPRVGSVRGKFAVWIKDLDAALYAIPTSTAVAPNPVGNDWNIDTPNVSDADLIRQKILDEISDDSKPEYIGLQPDDITFLRQVPAVTPPVYRNVFDFMQQLPTLNTLSSDPAFRADPLGVDQAYLGLKADVAFYLTPHLDDQGMVKLHPAGVNINTAPEEVIEAMLSQIPAYDTATGTSLTFATKDVGGMSLARLLANRIVGKRPFLCRMDFEDFVAAHLEGDPGDKNTPLGAVEYAIQFRKKQPTGNDHAELNTHQYLEIPGSIVDPPSHGSYDKLLYPVYMASRFASFRSDTNVSLPEASHAFVRLNAREFNNLLNSVFTHRFTSGERQLTPGDDRQVTPSGTTTTPGGIGLVVIHPGANEKLEASPNGNDVKDRRIIVSGSDGKLQSKATGTDVLVVEPSTPCIFPGTVGGAVVSGIPLNSDDQKITLESGGEIIIPGPNGVLETVPAAGDKIVMRENSYIRPSSASSGLQTPVDPADFLAEAIFAGADGKAETSVFGYSYYSHDSAPIDYKPKLNPLYGYDPTTGTNGDPAKFTDPANVGKFVYVGAAPDYEPAPITTALGPKQYKNYSMEDLKRWSCIGNGFRSGFYDFFFNFNDAMKLELDESETPSDPADVSIEGIDSAIKLRTQVRNPAGIDDLQEVPKGDPTAFAEDIVVFPGPNGLLETQPGAGDMLVKGILVGPTSSTTEAAGDTFTYNSNGDYIIVPDVAAGNTSLATTPDPAQGDVVIDLILAGTDTDADSTTYDDIFDDTTNTIQVGQNELNNTFVWGPMRASQNPSDMVAAENADQRPDANRDVSWSPPVAFRSRYFAIYVLALGTVKGWIGPELNPDDPNLRTNLKPAGERRLEAVYDALKDQIIWQRAPVSEKHSLAEP